LLTSEIALAVEEKHDTDFERLVGAVVKDALSAKHKSAWSLLASIKHFKIRFACTDGCELQFSRFASCRVMCVYGLVTIVYPEFII